MKMQFHSNFQGSDVKENDEMYIVIRIPVSGLFKAQQSYVISCPYRNGDVHKCSVIDISNPALAAQMSVLKIYNDYLGECEVSRKTIHFLSIQYFFTKNKT